MIQEHWFFENSVSPFLLDAMKFRRISACKLGVLSAYCFLTRFLFLLIFFDFTVSWRGNIPTQWKERTPTLQHNLLQLLELVVPAANGPNASPIKASLTILKSGTRMSLCLVDKAGNISSPAPFDLVFTWFEQGKRVKCNLVPLFRWRLCWHIFLQVLRRYNCQVYMSVWGIKTTLNH